MVESSDISSSVEYKEFELKHNRHLNMMQENVSGIPKLNLIVYRTEIFADRL